MKYILLMILFISSDTFAETKGEEAFKNIDEYLCFEARNKILRANHQYHETFYKINFELEDRGRSYDIWGKLYGGSLGFVFYKEKDLFGDRLNDPFNAKLRQDHQEVLKEITNSLNIFIYDQVAPHSIKDPKPENWPLRSRAIKYMELLEENQNIGLLNIDDIKNSKLYNFMFSPLPVQFPLTEIAVKLSSNNVGNIKCKKL
jgi:hypothetical protein